MTTNTPTFWTDEMPRGETSTLEEMLSANPDTGDVWADIVRVERVS